MATVAQYLRGNGRRKPGPWAKVDWTHPLARGLTSAWLFNEGGGTARDVASGNTFVPPFSYKVGGFGGPATNWQIFGGATPASQTGFLNANLTALCWVRLSANNQSTCFVDTYASTTGYALGISDTNANVVKWFTSTQGGSTITLGSTTTLANLAWYQCVGTYDGATTRLYINGRQEASSAWAGPIGYSGTGTRIGALATGSSQSFIGDMDHLLVWNRALAAGEISQLYNAPFAHLLQAAPRTFFLGGIAVDATVSAPAAGVTLNAPVPADMGDCLVSQPAATGSWNAPAASATAPLTVTEPASGATWNVLVPSPSAGATLSIPAASATWNAPAPAAGSGGTIAATDARANLIAPTAAASSGATSVAPAAATTWTAPAAVSETDIAPAQGTATAVWNAPPAISGTSTGVLDDFLVGHAFWDAPPPFAEAASDSAAPAATAVWNALAASVGIAPNAPAALITLNAPVPADGLGLGVTQPFAVALWNAPTPGVGLSDGVLDDFLVGNAFWIAPAPFITVVASGGGGTVHNRPLLGMGV